MRPLDLDQTRVPDRLHLGTSSFSSSDWTGVFYPERLGAADFLSYYAQKFRTVEIDATWHVMPSVKTVKAWERKTPDQFVFSLKVPKVITHERYLEGCKEEWERFLRTLDVLGAKRGPLLLQFQYVPKRKDAEEYQTGRDFLRRLRGFVPWIPEDVRVAVEVRNEKWLQEPLLDLLRENRIALTLVEYYTMPNAPALLRRIDPVTTDFTYVRFLGNHHEMDLAVAQARENGTRRRDWEALIRDREAETRAWVPAIQELLGRDVDVFSYFNNHYGGFAPGSIELFLKIWNEANGTS